MIRKPHGWDDVQVYSDRLKLPLGAYVCKIKQVNVVTASNGSEQLVLLYDIAEGDYTGFYLKDFQAQKTSSNTARYKGKISYFLPTDDGSDQDKTTQRILKGMTTAVEESNPGYKWNWEEKTLVGKTVGVVYQNREWEWEDKTGWSVQPYKTIDAEKVRCGEYKLPDDRPLKKDNQTSYGYGFYNAPASAPSASSAFTEIDNEDDLPF